jgi:nucleoid-associated protein YgaU
MHEVTTGENLFRIAILYYQDGSRWPAIFEANREIIGDNPSSIRIGQRLIIPDL